ncbi:MAG TPA: type II toxin-antitoxin system VapC family toxin [Alphaproteobacteria bacterium]
MTQYLLDTPVLLSFLAGKPDFSTEVHTIFADTSLKILASSANIFEVAVKKALKRIKIPDDFPDAVRESGFDILPIADTHAWKTLRLPFHHPDPFDRLLIAQAKCENLTLLTRNPIFERYDVNVQMV